jgi:hypothetical protein
MPKLPETIYIGLARTIYIYGKCKVLLVGNHPNIRYIQCIYTILANPIYTLLEVQTTKPIGCCRGGKEVLWDI